MQRLEVSGEVRGVKWLISTLDGVGGQHQDPAALPPGKTR